MKANWGECVHQTAAASRQRINEEYNMWFREPHTKPSLRSGETPEGMLVAIRMHLFRHQCEKKAKTNLHKQITRHNKMVDDGKAKHGVERMRYVCICYH